MKMKVTFCLWEAYDVDVDVADIEDTYEKTTQMFEEAHFVNAGFIDG